MKCAYCDDAKIIFTILKPISSDIAWASHVISDVDGECRLYHYQCGGVDILSIAQMYSDMSKG